MNGGSNYMPNDVVAEILSNLPSRSVWRFRLACKTWYSLISDPIFISLHCKRAPQSPKILYSRPGTLSQLQLLDYDSSSFIDCCLRGPINVPYCWYPEIVGSDRGLVCVATDYSGTFSIWNPLTKECKKLPNLSMKKKRYDYFHGLGYDSVADDFKLVISMDRIKYNIFSLKANSWKTITCPVAFEYYHPDAIRNPFHGILFWHSLAIVLNGIFHWLIAPANNDHEILAFDVGNETFQKLQLPQRVSRYFITGVNLLEHKGCLCISVSNKIWMLKEYDIWVHFLTIKNSPQFNCFRLPVLCISSTSEVVSHTDENFKMCRREEEEKLDEKFTRYPFMYKPVLYVETLVSPNARDEQQVHVETLVSSNNEDKLRVTAHKTKERKKLINQLILFMLVLFIYIVCFCLFLF